MRDAQRASRQLWATAERGAMLRAVCLELVRIAAPGLGADQTTRSRSLPLRAIASVPVNVAEATSASTRRSPGSSVAGSPLCAVTRTPRGKRSTRPSHGQMQPASASGPGVPSTRARLAAAQGASALARSDTDASLALLEETAAKLPRNLREVFWNNPRRRALRQVHTATMPAAASQSLSPSMPALGRLRDPRLSTLNATITSLGTPMTNEDRLSRIFEITRDLARERDLDRLLARVTDHAVARRRA